MNDKNLKKTKELIKYMDTEDLKRKLKEHNTQIYSEDVFQIIRNELEMRQKAAGKSTIKKSRNGLKEIIFVIVLIGILLATTSPSKGEYAEYIMKQAVQTHDSEDIVSKNYFIFTIFETDISGERSRAIGILKRFISLE
jgi:uncharacterized membrane protein affecting hemolysin expression